MKKALVIIDMQNDFVPGGNLAVPGGDEIVPIINALIPQYELVVATQDWHPANHKSFASQYDGKNVFDVVDLHGLNQVLWPVHCVQGTQGAKFHKDLEMNMVEAIFRKGMNPEIDSYSGFYDNGHLKSTGLAGYLRAKGVEELHFCGLAADYCVYFSMKDALREGFRTIIFTNATRAIDNKSFENQLNELKAVENFDVKDI